MSAVFSAFDGFEHKLRCHGRRLAVQDDQGSLSYAELGQRLAQLRSGLKAAGLGPQDRIAVVAKNRAEMLLLLLSALSGGPIFVPVNRRISTQDMQWIIEDAQCSAVFADAECAAALDEGLAGQIPPEQRFCFDPQELGWRDFGAWLGGLAPATSSPGRGDPQRIYLQIYTSGTSGRPKGVMLSPANALAQLSAVVLSADIDLTPGEAMYQALPLFHVGGVFASLWALSRGVCLILRQEFHPVQADALLSSGQVQHAALVPAMIQACLAVPAAASYAGLRSIMYGASPIARSALVAAMRRFDCDFLQVYGMSETHSVISLLGAADHRELVENPDSQLASSAGRAVAGTVISICDPLGRELDCGEVGEIRVASGHVMQGYWNAPGATAEAMREGQLCTGDAGYLDEAGYLHIVDRLKDIIVSGGENVSSLEVESVLLQHPQVADVAVIGTPSAQWGEAVTALIVSAGGPLDEAALGEHCRQSLGGFQVPRRYEQVDAIPRNAGGKILKARLREQYWQGQSRHVA